ncbi:M23 family metallopeptidase [Mucilaginibacter sp. Bleaf8]|uniref:M23 family metallopeptidase n=1 Tax=Mucilaginibacter sp. Bleaf8 TaxID=2834430 RepID=UPI001BCD8639|nr:M23 family metallopeptidase [Mucilaginibacter sp. Bleaf8]MBS7565576.1 M23 family metallopeptidase [Mucilaginibacter sp. Bleaf8]
MKFLFSLCIVCLPLKHLHINSGFGYRVHPLSGRYILHEGIDLRARHDTVYAILNGVVTTTGYQEGLGVYIRLTHGEVQSVYGHLSQVMVGAGESVSAGEPIGITGATGRVTGEHLHFSIRYRQRPVNPIQFLYVMLTKIENEQKFQSTSRAAFGKADRGN